MTQQLIDEAALHRYLDDTLPGEGPFEVARHQAGHSNETFFIGRSGHRWVLRRPPLGAFLPTAHDVGREFRVLAALQDADVRVPRTLVMCEDADVIGAPFYVMEAVEGVVLRESLPDAYAEADAALVGEELVDALAELHAVDVTADPLALLAKHTGYLDRQLRRWRGQLELTLPYTRPLPDLERVGAWLAEHVPASGPTTLVHGDYKLDNVVFSAGPPARLLAVLDWEMSTLGDPLADLGWMISFWRDDEEVDDLFAGSTAASATPGTRTRDELVDRYAERTGRSVEDLDWYETLAVWKLAILLEGSYARHLAGMTDDPFFERMKDGVPSLGRRALSVAGLSG